MTIDIDSLDDLDAELDELGAGALAKPKPAKLETGFEDLEDFLEEVKAEAAEKANILALKKKQKENFSGMKREDAEACSKIIRAYEREQAWIPQANVVVCARITCMTCMVQTTVFSRFMQKQVARHNPTSKRLETVEELSATLPTVHAVDLRTSPTCPHCVWGSSNVTPIPLSKVLSS